MLTDYMIAKILQPSLVSYVKVHIKETLGIGKRLLNKMEQLYTWNGYC